MPLPDDLRQLNATSPFYATEFVDKLLAAAVEGGASDIHLRPTQNGLLVEWRIDGVLARVGEFPRGSAADVVSRLKVMSELLTYRTDVPQEGRIRPAPADTNTTTSNKKTQPPATNTTTFSLPEIRVSTFPTLHGERAAIRLFAGEGQYLHLADLHLPDEIAHALTNLLTETSGAMLMTGPAGSGKTTTAYACLREIVRTSSGRRSLVTLEDPIESALEGVSQSQVQPAAGFTLATGLRSLMRQDPEVILVGEIRDTETSEIVFQASLTGHLVFSTFHAGSAAGALSRLLDMGIEPYLITSGLRAVLHQRLVRKLCTCSQPITSEADLLGLSIATTNQGGARKASGCEACRHTGYKGRLALAEMLPPLTGALSEAILHQKNTADLNRIATTAGMTPMLNRALQVVHAGQTDATEVRRVLGFATEH